MLNAPKNPLGCYELSRYGGDYDKMLEQILSIYRGILHQAQHEAVVRALNIGERPIADIATPGPASRQASPAPVCDLEISMWPHSGLSNVTIFSFENEAFIHKPSVKSWIRDFQGLAARLIQVICETYKHLL